MRRTTSLRTGVAVLSAVALVSAGCGASAPPTPATPTAGATTPAAGSATSTGADTTATAQGQAVAFAACIRGHGVPHFPDPDAKGDFVFGIDVSPAVWQRAVAACKALEPPGALSGRRSPKQQSAALRFAGCMREHGVRDFPDPANGDPLVDTTRIPSSERPGGMTILNAAMKRCGSVLGLAAGGQG
jgi:hypothetical protein